MRDFFRNFRRIHLYIFLGCYVLFAGVTAWALAAQSASDQRQNWNVAAVIGTVSGPFTGAIARGFQACCWRFSLSVFPYCLGILLSGVALQIIPLPFRRGERPFRLVAWTLGWLGWFAGAVASFLHALS